MEMMIKNSLMILVLLAFVGCAKDKPTFNALDKKYFIRELSKIPAIPTHMWCFTFDDD